MQRAIFPVRMNAEERETLRNLAQAMRRSEADTLRTLLIEAALQLKEGKQCKCTAVH